MVVTGAASGIGLATVRRLLDDGAGVVGCDLGPGNEMPDGSGGYTFVTADVTDEAAVAEVFAAAPGRITGVIHSAGVASGGPVHLLDRAEWDRVITINLTGTFLVAKAALGRMVDQERVDGERGSIVTLASVEGIEGTAGGSCYNASKGGVVLLTKNIAIDYGPIGIRCNAICPGFIDTPLLASVLSDPFMADARQKTSASTPCAGWAVRTRSPPLRHIWSRVTRRSSVGQRCVDRRRAVPRLRRWTHLRRRNIFRRRLVQGLDKHRWAPLATMGSHRRLPVHVTQQAPLGISCPTARFRYSQRRDLRWPRHCRTRCGAWACLGRTDPRTRR